jgi:hypothetical protein
MLQSASYAPASWILLVLIAVAGTGCCCVQGVPGACSTGCDGNPISMGCGSGCGVGAIAGLASCRGACGEVYVDEWVSEPPVADNCGYPCGGCGNCGQCQPIRSVLRLLWGRPYMTGCSTGLCGPSCDGSCDSGGFTHAGYPTQHSGGMHFSGSPASSHCNCGQNHSMMPGNSSEPIRNFTPESHSTPLEVTPEVVPTPAPDIMPSSAKRLNPALRRG